MQTVGRTTVKMSEGDAAMWDVGRFVLEVKMTHGKLDTNCLSGNIIKTWDDGQALKIRVTEPPRSTVLAGINRMNEPSSGHQLYMGQGNVVDLRDLHTPPPAFDSDDLFDGNQSLFSQTPNWMR